MPVTGGYAKNDRSTPCLSASSAYAAIGGAVDFSSSLQRRFLHRHRAAEFKRFAPVRARDYRALPIFPPKDVTTRKYLPVIGPAAVSARNDLVEHLGDLGFAACLNWWHARGLAELGSGPCGDARRLIHTLCARGAPPARLPGASDFPSVQAILARATREIEKLIRENSAGNYNFDGAVTLNLLKRIYTIAVYLRIIIDVKIIGAGSELAGPRPLSQR